MNQDAGPQNHEGLDPIHPPTPPRRGWAKPHPAAFRPSGAAQGMVAAINWAVLGVLTIVIVAVQSIGGAPSTSLPKDPAEVSNLQLTFAGKYFLGIRSALGGDLAQQVGDQFTTTFDRRSLNAVDRARLAIFIAEAGDVEAAREHLDSLKTDLEESIKTRREELNPPSQSTTEPADDASGDETSESGVSTTDSGEELSEEEIKEKQEQLEIREELLKDVALLTSLYTDGPDALTDDDRAYLVQRHSFFGDVALAYGKDPNDPARRKIEAAGTRLIVLLVVALVGGAMLGIAGIVLLIIAVIRMASGTFRWRMPPMVDAARPMSASLMQVLILFLISFLVLTGIGGAIESLFEEPPAFSPAIALMWLALLVVLWPKILGARWSDLRTAIGWNRGEGFFKEIAAGFVGYIAGLPIVAVGFGLVFLILAIQSMAGQEAAGPSHPAVEEMIGGGLWETIALYSLACIWAPIVEETMFRGAFFASLRTRFGTVVEPAMITAFIFAAIHPQGFVGLPALMALAIVFALMREWRGSIIAPMVAHALNNFLVITFFMLAVA